MLTHSFLILQFTSFTNLKKRDYFTVYVDLLATPQLPFNLEWRHIIVFIYQNCGEIGLHSDRLVLLGSVKKWHHLFAKTIKWMLFEFFAGYLNALLGIYGYQFSYIKSLLNYSYPHQIISKLGNYFTVAYYEPCYFN